MTWTPERIAELRRLLAAGATASEAAEKLGCGITRNAVIGKASRDGMRFVRAKHGLHPDIIARMHERLDAGVQRKVIAAELGIHPNTIVNHAGPRRPMGAQMRLTLPIGLNKRIAREAAASNMTAANYARRVLARALEWQP